MLGEIHIALLRTIIKDIEDVARTPATALGANQNSGANPGGGHPQIVEGVGCTILCFLFILFMHFSCSCILLVIAEELSLFWFLLTGLHLGF